MKADYHYKVAYLGIPGSFSYQAAIKYFKSEKYMTGCSNINEVFNLVSQSQNASGIVPIENSTTGSILETYDSLISNNLAINGELVLNISHALLATPITKDMEEIKICYSHQQAFRQCADFFHKNKHLKTILTEDTASAAKLISGKNKIGLAAVASLLSAKIYNLKILKKHLEDNPYNSTRFIIINKLNSQKGNKMAIVFSLAHKPGSLVESLKPIADAGYNLTKIESRPVPNKPWEYLFYVDFELTQGESKLSGTLNRMKESINFLKILGCFQKGVTYGS